MVERIDDKGRRIIECGRYRVAFVRHGSGWLCAVFVGAIRVAGVYHRLLETALSEASDVIMREMQDLQSLDNEITRRGQSHKEFALYKNGELVDAGTIDELCGRHHVKATTIRAMATPSKRGQTTFARPLDIGRAYKRWTQADEEFLIEHPDWSTTKLAFEMGRTESSIRSRRARLKQEGRL